MARFGRRALLPISPEELSQKAWTKIWGPGLIPFPPNAMLWVLSLAIDFARGIYAKGLD